MCIVSIVVPFGVNLILYMIEPLELVNRNRNYTMGTIHIYIYIYIRIDTLNPMYTLKTLNKPHIKPINPKPELFRPVRNTRSAVL